MLFFTEKGRCFWLNVYQIPEGEKNSKGRAIQNLLQISPDDKVRAIIDIPTWKMWIILTLIILFFAPSRE
jgi:DNA gyrase subunit A